ncbi:MAG: methyl-accepting chemotaxis protein [Ignavibacteriales bacterium]
MLDTTKQKKAMLRTYAVSALSIACVVELICGAIFCLWYDPTRIDLWIKVEGVFLLGGIIITPLTLRRNYKNFLKPIWVMMDFINAMAHGDLTGTLNDYNFGTLDVMKDPLVRMRLAVRQLIYQVASMAGMIGTSSVNLSTEVENTRAVAREVAVAVSEVAQSSGEQAVAVEAISHETGKIGQIAANIAEASKNMVIRLIEAQEMVSGGAENIEEQQNHLQANRELIERMNVVVMDLAQKSQEIGAIMDAISEIANQTNLLALNASIEAARTGERGRGFQVVAQQVRKLADESSQAAIETGRLIEGIRDSINQVARQTTAAEGIVRDQQGIMNDNYKVIENVTHNMTIIKTETDNLNDSITTINKSLSHVGSTVENMSAITEQTAAGADQIADGANQQVEMMSDVLKVAKRLADISQELRDHSDRFTLPEDMDKNAVIPAVVSYDLKAMGRMYRLKSLAFSVPFAAIAFGPFVVLAAGATHDPGAWVMGPICAAMAAFFPTWIATNNNFKNIILPTGVISQHAEAVASGNLNAELQPHENLGKLIIMRDGFNGMVGALKSSTTGILGSCVELNGEASEAVRGATQTAESAQLVATTLGDIANGATTQAIEISEVSEELNHIVDSLQNIMSGAVCLKTNAEEARMFIERGVNAAAGKKSVITGSMEAMTKVFGVIKELEGKSVAIGQVVNVITDIASETNLLALNAAIEAARAGDEGRGFAVVAGEVRKLAEETLGAAQKIYILIEDIQDGTRHVVGGMDELQQAFDQQVQAILDSEQILVKVNNRVIPISEDSLSIVESCDTMEAAARRIADDSRSIAASSQEVAAASQEVVAATEEQERSVDKMQHQIEEFSKFTAELYKRIQLVKIN